MAEGWAKCTATLRNPADFWLQSKADLSIVVGSCKA